MTSIRRCTTWDLFSMQECNLFNLPENYMMKYYFFHVLSWPNLLHIHEDHEGRLNGYVMAKMEDEFTSDRHGHVTSLAVMRSHRKLGIASKAMTHAQNSMENGFAALYASLHVRVTNRAAFTLYSKTLGYSIHEMDRAYYADKEDAFNMRNYFGKDSDRKRIKIVGFEEDGGAAPSLQQSCGAFSSAKSKSWSQTAEEDEQNKIGKKKKKKR